VAFPGAQGYGAGTVGGRGGKVIYVTNLNDSGPGSLRAALETKGPRIILFSVSGTIEATKDLTIREPFVTVAGQSAPGDGITIKNATFKIIARDVIVRFIRVRVGDLVEADRDAVSIINSRNVIMDHLSVSWGVDENLSVADSENITLQWNIVGEPLHESVHSEGPHGKCSLIRGSAFVSLLNNLYAHCPDRSPHLDAKRVYPPRMQVVNNLSFDYGDSSVKIAAYDDPNPTAGWYDIVNNLFIAGPRSRSEVRIKETQPGAVVHVAGNLGPRRTSATQDPWVLVTLDGSSRAKLEFAKPSLATVANTLDATAAGERVLRLAGATVPKRDSADERLVVNVRDKRTGWINSQRDVGGWPVLAGGKGPLDTDGDGMPDAWETAKGLDANKAADGAQDRDGDGYTNVEEYLNSLVPAQN
jgi:hypothetical protein